MVRNHLMVHEREFSRASEELRRQSHGVEQLQQSSFRRLRAWLRGILPGVLERQRADFVEALHHLQSTERSLHALRSERDRLEQDLSELRQEEKLFSEAALKEARERREKRQDPDASHPPAKDSIEEMVHILHDISDLEGASTALGAASHHLEAVHDALDQVVQPGLLQVISGLALLDLFESPEIQLARSSFEEARRDVRWAGVALEALETVHPSETTLKALALARDYHFLHGLYHEGKIAKVLQQAREDVAGFRESIWGLRNRTRTIKDGLLTQLYDLRKQSLSPPPP
jgi:hypothetical protein